VDNAADMSWIKTVPYDEAKGRLKKLYDRVKGPDNNVDNIMMSHSLRPHSMEGHMALYKYVLHHSANTVPKSFLETLGVYVSILNNCGYCIEHHFQGLVRLLGDNDRAAQIRTAFEKGVPETAISGKELAAITYANVLTLRPSEITENHVQVMRDAGFDDGEILEINQVVSYFCYANRTILGLGTSTEGDIIGLSPGNSDNPDDWNHA
jgi:uncharacterized peroxidase-related enzyme